MNSPIVFVSGSKGGVGKSITTMAVLDYLLTSNRYVKLLESDTTNPDVWKSYGRAVESEVVNLDGIDGWIHLVNSCDAEPEATFVVNTPARNNDAVHEHGSILMDSLQELGRPLVTLWVINRQRDSLELLKSYLEIMNAGVVHVICNGYFGEARKFELYEQSALKQTIQRQGGMSLYLPDLADRVTDALYTGRFTLDEAAKQLRLGDRAVLQSWRNSVRELLTRAAV
ncbi:MAG: protein mobD [Terracidiphilus sp.]|jgi:hypothetical protein